MAFADGSPGDRLPPRRLAAFAAVAEPRTRFTREACPSCRRPGMTVLDLQVGAGESPAQMRSCEHCGSRSWWRDGREVPVSEVVDVVRRTGGPKRGGRRPARPRT